MFHYLFTAPKLNSRNSIFMIYNAEIISAGIIHVTGKRAVKFRVHRASGVVHLGSCYN